MTMSQVSSVRRHQPKRDGPPAAVGKKGAATSATPENGAECTSASCKRKRGLYVLLPQEKRVEIAKDAICNGPTATARKYGISQSTVRSIRDSYKKQWKGKSGPPILLGKYEAMLNNYLLRLCQGGATIDRHIVVAAATCIIEANEPTLLSQHGGPLDLSSDAWVQSFLQRHSQIKHKGANAAQKPSANLSQPKDTFLDNTNKAATARPVPSQLVVNLDNTDPSHELAKVCQEIEQVEQQVQNLIELQNKLIEKRAQLKKLIRDNADQDKSQDWEKNDFPWSKRLIEVRGSVFGIDVFRPLQLKTMNATLSGKDCILIMPTGGGKSLCFQLPALISEGVTLVVSPLVSLMEDQVMALERINVAAALLNASSSKEHVKYVHDSMSHKECPFKMLYVTPEKLAKSKRFMAKLEKMFEADLFSRLVIDEVHCCSQWGHDFRPDYKFLGVMRRQFPGVPILGLTATATNNVLQDVKKILGIEGCLVFRASFNRTNLFYEVYAKPSGVKNSVNDIHKLITSRFDGQSGIIYCLTQKDTEEVAHDLQERGVQASYYHANMDAKYRRKTHTEWINNDIKIIVATIAFGMGIDKPDVRFVIHHSISKSIENYYQESGRAGRDDKEAYCILFAGFSDIPRQSTMVFTEQTGLSKLYGMIEYAYDIGRCRRTLIAEYFGEQWSSSLCDKMCDYCKPKPTADATSLQDVTDLCRDVITIVDSAKQKGQRITAIKLLESAMGRGATVLRVKSVGSTSVGQQNVERVLVFMLLNGYLREDFHFSPYTTISYLLRGPNADLLNSPSHKVELTLQMTPGGASGQKSTPRRQTTSKQQPARVKPVAVTKAPSRSVPSRAARRRTESKETIREPRRPNKRTVISNGESSEDTNLGDVEVIVVGKKVKRETDPVKDSCITISDDDEDEDFA